MSRSLSLDLLNAMYAERTGEVVICLLEINHPSFDAPYYLSSNATERVSVAPLTYKTVSNGIDYIYCPFSIQPPDDNEEQAPTTRFSVENVTRLIVGEIRSLDPRLGRATATIKLVTASDPDFIEVEYPEFDIYHAGFNENAVVIEARIDALMDIPYPAHTFNPAWFPGLHQ